MGFSLGDPLRRTNDGEGVSLWTNWAHLGGEHELVQGHYYQDYCFRCGVGGNGERRTARVGADIPELSLCRRIAGHCRIFPILQARPPAYRWNGPPASQTP